MCAQIVITEWNVVWCFSTDLLLFVLARAVVISGPVKHSTHFHYEIQQGYCLAIFDAVVKKASSYIRRGETQIIP